MIKSFKYKGLRLLWETGNAGKLPADQLNRIKQMLEVIDSAQLVPQDFKFFLSWKIHPLKGSLKGYWSLTVKENWRIIFGFDGQTAFDLDYLDYH
ncbi:MAG: type II toxin-antitoxin system RelE/ParE family toxin [Chitinophagaceae bacterium]|nr:type II toxin-antitoxin system RelE/ParE family toxin [Chitinophagaceae bacterium]